MPPKSGLLTDLLLGLKASYARVGQAHLIGLSMIISLTAFALSLWYLLSKFSWQHAWMLLFQADWHWMILATIPTILLFFLVRTVRWFILLRKAGVSIDFVELYFCNAMLVGLGVVTPLNAIELVKVEILKKRNMFDRSQGYSSFALERLMDLLVVVIIAAGAVAVGLPHFFHQAPSLFILLGFAAILGLILLMLMNHRSRLLAAPLSWLRQNLIPYLREPKTLLAVGFFTTLSWLLVAAFWQISLQSVAIPVGFFQVTGIMFILTLLFMVVWVPGNVGTAELGIITFLQYYGIPVVDAQAGALMLRVCSLIVILMAILHLPLWALYAAIKKKIKPVRTLLDS
jgi:uncharacterized membrane protein YbhN (UPF0104 family)